MESARLPQVRLEGVRLLAGLLRSHFLETRSDRCSCKTAFHPTSDLYLNKVAVMAPTIQQLRLSKTHGSHILQLRFPTGYGLNRDKFDCRNHQKSSSKAQIAACLLMICAVAERGGLYCCVFRNSLRFCHFVRNTRVFCRLLPSLSSRIRLSNAFPSLLWTSKVLKKSNMSNKPGFPCWVYQTQRVFNLS
jgi:hypothetical protein